MVHIALFTSDWMALWLYWASSNRIFFLIFHMRWMISKKPHVRSSACLLILKTNSRLWAPRLSHDVKKSFLIVFFFFLRPSALNGLFARVNFIFVPQSGRRFLLSSFPVAGLPWATSHIHALALWHPLGPSPPDSIHTRYRIIKVLEDPLDCEWEEVFFFSPDWYVFFFLSPYGPLSDSFP